VVYCKELDVIGVYCDIICMTQ